MVVVYQTSIEVLLNLKKEIPVDPIKERETGGDRYRRIHIIIQRVIGRHHDIQQQEEDNEDSLGSLTTCIRW